MRALCVRRLAMMRAWPGLHVCLRPLRVEGLARRRRARRRVHQNYAAQIVAVDGPLLGWLSKNKRYLVRVNRGVLPRRSRDALEPLRRAG